jgi:hypothetical protein
LFREHSVLAAAVSGNMNKYQREEVLREYEYGNLQVLCACDLLNEGWDSPITEVLFMARPTLSKTLYIQQLGRGLRVSEGKTNLCVFDFIDNANLFNTPYSVHRVFNVAEYKAGAYVVGPDHIMEKQNRGLFFREKPILELDFPLHIQDYELIDLFNWQEKVRDMISQQEFVRQVDVQSETVERYIRDGKIAPDMSVPIGELRKFHYFHKESVRKYADQYGWDLITAQNIKDKFMEMVLRMDMSYSYKPVLIKAMLHLADEHGKVPVSELTNYFIKYYAERICSGLVAERKKSLVNRIDVDLKEVEKLILRMPFKRFEDMRFMKRSRDIQYIEFNHLIWRKLIEEEKRWIITHCDEKLKKYYKE